MKKKGITLTEILVAVTIFSLGIVPLMLSLNSSFKATVFNRDYTKAMEYNAQLIEEIAAMMPTKVSKSNYTGLVGPGSLEEDVRSMLMARSEDKASKKGIYILPKWEGNRFEFSSTEPEDNSMYRKIVVGNLEDTALNEKRLPIEIEAYYLKGEFIASTRMAINLKDETIEDDNLVDSGDSGGTKIQVKGEKKVPETGNFKGPSEDVRYVIVYLMGSGSNPEKILGVDLEATKNGLKQPLKKINDSQYSGQITLKAGEGFVFYLRSGNGTANLHEGLRYEFYRNPPQ